MSDLQPKFGDVLTGKKYSLGFYYVVRFKTGSKMNSVENMWTTTIGGVVVLGQYSWYNGLDRSSTTKTQLIHSLSKHFPTLTPNNPLIHSSYNYY